MAEPKPAEPGHIPIDQAARLLMVSGERVRQLIKMGYIPRPVPGQTTLVGAVQGYIKFLKDDDRRSSKSAAESRVRDARAAEIEMRIAEKRRELVPREDAMAAIDLIVGKVKEEMNGQGARLTRDMELRRKIENDVHASQIRLAETIGALADFLEKGGELPDAGTDNDP